MNWAIGCIGQSVPTPRPFDKEPTLPVGTFDSPGKPVAPQKSYLAQPRRTPGPEGPQEYRL